ncbi:alcohol oxidase [Gigaspora margarita]|uniref:Alcohol oxidase n=1 Tax=Gigaspora margarita TaxID=4874 RepID=A0A8H4A0Y6_GIGMA|nr:alcohol oxidase [Gigaspora margarita]
MKNICNHNKYAKFKIKETYNFIIIGAGTAGCVLTRKLIHGIPNINILVLEAGEPNVHANSLINLLFIGRENEGLVYFGLLGTIETFKALENNLRENPDEKFKQLYGFNGLHHVQNPHNRTYDIILDLIDTMKNLEIPYNDDFNSEKQNSVRRFQGKRCSLANGYLRDALKNIKFHPGSEPNDFVDVRSYAHVLEIIWDKENKKENIATNIRYFCNSTVREAFIAQKGEVIICSGTINSPQVKNMKFNNNALVIVHYYKLVK